MVAFKTTVPGPQVLLSAAPEVLCEEVNGEAVILNLATGRYFGLNEVGSRMWRLLSAGVGRDAAVSILLDEYDVPRDELEQDVARLSEQLMSAGLLEHVVEQDP